MNKMWIFFRKNWKSIIFALSLLIFVFLSRLLLKNEIERVYLGNLDLSEITFKILSNEEMKDLIPFDYNKFYDVEKNENVQLF